jgi:hypothetical protein
MLFMPKWKRDQKEFAVSVTYHEQKGSQCYLPKPILKIVDVHNSMSSDQSTTAKISVHDLRSIDITCSPDIRFMEHNADLAVVIASNFSYLLKLDDINAERFSF